MRDIFSAVAVGVALALAIHALAKKPDPPPLQLVTYTYGNRIGYTILSGHVSTDYDIAAHIPTKETNSPIILTGVYQIK